MRFMMFLVVLVVVLAAGGFFYLLREADKMAAGATEQRIEIDAELPR